MGDCYKQIVYISKLLVYIMKMKNEERVVLEILKNPDKEYNANSLSKIVGLTPMGTLKILKRLEGRKILIKRRVSNIFFYNINFTNSYTIDYVSLVLKSEVEARSNYVIRWVNELRKIRSASIVILFGSVLNNGNKANDVDVLFVVKKGMFDVLENEVEKINIINDKKIHSIFQEKKDLVKNIRKGDKVVLNAIKGVVVFGEGEFINILGGLYGSR